MEEYKRFTIPTPENMNTWGISNWSWHYHQGTELSDSSASKKNFLQRNSRASALQGEDKPGLGAHPWEKCTHVDAPSPVFSMGLISTSSQGKCPTWEKRVRKDGERMFRQKFGLFLNSVAYLLCYFGQVTYFVTQLSCENNLSFPDMYRYWIISNSESFHNVLGGYKINHVNTRKSEKWFFSSFLLLTQTGFLFRRIL